MNNNLYVLKELEDKIDKAQVKNTLTETAEGSVLDARQGKVLNDKIDTKASKQELGTLSELTTTKKDSLVSALNEVKQSIPSTASINQTIDEKVATHNQSNTSHQDIRNEIKVLSGERGYLSTKQLEDNTDFNDIPKLNGIYMVSTRTNAPMTLDYNVWYFVKVTVHNELYLTQEAWTFTSEKSQRWVRTLYNNVWQSWENIVTMDKMNDKRFIRANSATDGRDIPTKPSDYVLGLFTNQIKTVASMGILGGGYAHAIGINEWTDTTAGVHELIFAGQKVYHRESASSDTWGQLHELATTRKTLNVKSQDDWGNDFNNANINGMYHIINCQSLTNRPPTNENVGNLIVMSGTEDNSLSKVQYFIPFNNTGFYIRTRGYGLDEWQEWKEIATTTKTGISITPNTGYAITKQGSYTSNGEMTIQIQVEKADGGTFYVGDHSIANFPLNISTTISISTTCLAYSGGIVNGGSAIVENWNNNLRIHVEDAATKYIWLTGIVRLA